MLQQTAYHIAKPAVLKEQLQNIGLNEEKVCQKSNIYRHCSLALLATLPDNNVCSDLDLTGKGSVGEAKVKDVLPLPGNSCY